MTDIVAFLTARLDEDEAAAKAVPHVDWTDYDGWAELDSSVRAHAYRHDPPRVLADVAAKREIVMISNSMRRESDRGAEILADVALRALAAVHADHPDYDESWRP